MTRRPETAQLHGPWPDLAPDPDAQELTSLQQEFEGEWKIWRAISAQRANGDWCARRIVSGQPSAGLSAASPGELRMQIEQTS